MKLKAQSCKIFYWQVTLQAVSNPKLAGTSLHFKSPSMVFGHPITRVFKFFPLVEQKWQQIALARQMEQRYKKKGKTPILLLDKNH